MEDKERILLVGGPGHGRVTVAEASSGWLEIPVPLSEKVDSLYWTFFYRVEGNVAIWIRRN